MSHDAAPPRDAQPILVSACLAGIACRYDGAAKRDGHIVALVEAGLAIPVCAEILGGLATPRPPAEISGGDGHDVLAGRAHVITASGEDVSEAFVEGASRVVDLARERGVTVAVLQPKSPSCGVGQIYDGSHERRLREGDGVLVAALKQVGVEVVAHRPETTNT
ncbi:DUF523 domain-containing protein [Schaalia suimastitidis]|uniref:DUF523 domain-containing protein n=1 Tax=Schaalia suimastitidis TaxID=121163 RepID=UPI0004038685|nr:DUF523 domain-containing protein [Schaalia suimastitidis]